MNTSLTLCRAVLRILAATAVVCLLAACVPDPGVSVTTPAPGSNVATLPAISGEWVGLKEADVSLVKVRLVRYSDGKAWNGSTWGATSGTASLNASVNVANETWACTAALPSGANLPVDYYSITVDATYTNGSKAQATSVFSVGVSSAPVTPAPYGWGFNEDGQLGVGSTADVTVPVQVPTRGVLEGKLVVAVSAGAKHSLALTSEGRVYAWGTGLLGQGGTSDDALPVAVSTTAPSALAGKKIVAVSAGSSHSLAVDEAGQVYAWGNDLHGELGTGTAAVDQALPVAVGGVLTGKQVIAVQAGTWCSAALTRQGEVFTWGHNISGQLGNGSNTSSAVPVAVTGLAGKLVTRIALTSGHVLSLTDAGEVWAWGSGSQGRLGNGGTADSNVPVRAGGSLIGKTVTAIATGSAHSLAVAGGKVYSWGWAEMGQLGLGGSGTTDPDVLTPTEVGGVLVGKKITSVYGGEEFSMAFTENSEGFAWGKHHKSQLLGVGAGSRVPVACDLSTVLSGGRQVLGVSTTRTGGLILTGLKPVPSGELIVEPNLNDVLTRVSSGTTVNLGTDAIGGTKSLYISLRNNGDSDLTDFTVSVDGAHQADFFAGFSLARLAPGATNGFFVYFQPQNGTGLRTATLHIRSSDTKNSPFDIVLNGTAYRGGIVDPAFATPALTSNVRTTAVQLDSQILVGGDFTDIGGVTRQHLARLAADGTVDSSFAPTVNDVVNCIVVQPDGKIVIGGPFNLVNGVARNRLARLNSDGTLDTAFNPDGGTGEILGMALQTDGKIVIAGSFSDVGSSGLSRLARLNADGTVDSGFTPTVNGTVNSVVVMADGRVVIGGAFTTVGGVNHQRVARLSSTGTVDATFNPHITNGVVNCVVVQPSGRVIMAGSFSNLNIGSNNYTRNNVARVTTTGALDTTGRTFDPNVNGAVTAMTLQADESVIIGGNFTTVGGASHIGLARLFGFGDFFSVTDYNFNTNVDGPVNGITLQKDGRMILAGGFGTVGGASSPRLARILNNSVFENIVVPTLDTIFWNRGGGAPEIHQATFDVSADGGLNWVPLGTATRNVSGTLNKTGLVLPSPGMIRARGFPVGGSNGGSSGYIETIASYGGPPEINVVSTGGVAQASGSARDFGVVATGTGISTVTFTVSNAGPGTLTAVNSAFITGPGAASFRITGTPSASVAAGGTTDIVITFSPRNQGAVPAGTLLRIPNNDADESQYDIQLTGIGGVDTANWKIQNSQVGVADTADTDGDGLTTLEENAFGTNPASFSGAAVSLTPPAGGGGGGGSSATFTFNYTRNKLALGDLVFQVQWSDTLGANDWHTDDVTEQILSDNGQQQQVQATLPAGTGKARFARLRITRP